MFSNIFPLVRPQEPKKVIKIKNPRILIPHEPEREMQLNITRMYSLPLCDLISNFQYVDSFKLQYLLLLFRRFSCFALLSLFWANPVRVNGLREIQLYI